MKKHNSIFISWRHFKYLFKKPLTIPFSEILTVQNAKIRNDDKIIKSKSYLESSPRVGADNLRGFHTNNWEECIGCGTCADICPTEAIDMTERLELDEKDGSFQVR
ncbi:MAG: 4Fe-4S binding protein, partial [Candidatus Izemoplasma sp.]